MGKNSVYIVMVMADNGEQYPEDYTQIRFALKAFRTYESAAEYLKNKSVLAKDSVEYLIKNRHVYEPEKPIGDVEFQDHDPDEWEIETWPMGLLIYDADPFVHYLFRIQEMEVCD